MIRGVATTPAAEADLDEIWFSIALGSPDRADRFLDKLTQRFVSLARSSRMGRSRPELLSDLRSIAFRGYVVFYSLSGEGVLIERVLHGSRDIERIFKGR